jgi:hypothetical protein
VEFVGAIAPPLGVGLLFWWVIRAVLRADRTEREENARLELEHRRATAGEQRGA